MPKTCSTPKETHMTSPGEPNRVFDEEGQEMFEAGLKCQCVAIHDRCEVVILRRKKEDALIDLRPAFERAHKAVHRAAR